jgi:hypothetical protein
MSTVLIHVWYALPCVPLVTLPTHICVSYCLHTRTTFPCTCMVYALNKSSIVSNFIMSTSIHKSMALIDEYIALFAWELLLHQIKYCCTRWPLLCTPFIIRSTHAVVWHKSVLRNRPWLLAWVVGWPHNTLNWVAWLLLRLCTCTMQPSSNHQVLQDNQNPSHPIIPSHAWPVSQSVSVQSYCYQTVIADCVSDKKHVVTRCTSCSTCLLISQSGTYPPIPQVPRARGLIAACHQSTPPVSPISCCNTPSALACLAASPWQLHTGKIWWYSADIRSWYTQLIYAADIRSWYSQLIYAADIHDITLYLYCW